MGGIQRRTAIPLPNLQPRGPIIHTANFSDSRGETGVGGNVAVAPGRVPGDEIRRRELHRDPGTRFAYLRDEITCWIRDMP